MKEISENHILNQVQQLLINQTKKGLNKYGTTVKPDNLNTIEWLAHASEEIIDLLVYLTVMREKSIEDSIKAKAFDEIRIIMDDYFFGFIENENEAIAKTDEIVQNTFIDIYEMIDKN